MIGVAVVVLLNPEGKLLAVSRKDNRTDFGLPGGKMEPGETFEECAIRETREETGLEISDPVEIFRRMDGIYEAVAFAAHWTGEIQSREGEGEARWVDPQEILKGSFGDYNRKLFAALGWEITI